nr:putative reverse transcriptase domain-containing protein [Tanacetum cinerariifolium]
MDWLSRYNAVIACAEKLVRIPFGNEILTIHGEGSNERNESQLNIISCSKAQEYMSKGCHVFLVNITSTKDEDKSKGKRLEDVPVVREFPKVFPEHLPGVVRFGKRRKLNPTYVRPFKVLEKIGKVAYKLELPEELSRVHNTFYVSNLKKCHADEPLVIPLDGLHFDDKLHFVVEPVEIVDREVKRLKRSRIPLVK